VAFMSDEDVARMGFAHVGRNVKLSTRASFYDTDRISIGDNSRIDDFCVLSGRVEVGRNVHIAVFCNVAGGRAGVRMDDFSALAYGCHVIAQSDDYSGNAMTGPTVPSKYKNETSARITIGKHALMGTNTVVLPGVTIHDGVSSGAGTLFIRSPEAWTIYVGSPARALGPRSQAILALERQYLADESEPG